MKEIIVITSYNINILYGTAFINSPTAYMIYAQCGGASINNKRDPRDP